MRRCGHAGLTALFACAASLTGVAAADDTSAGVAALSGAFTLLTYNVAGLPVLVSQSEPVRSVPLIGGLLNLGGVGVVQEVFAYHGALPRAATHSYRTEPLSPSDKVGIGDG